MSKFFIAWAAKKPEPLPEVHFEYLIHPHGGEGGVNYFNALVEADDRKAAWRTVLGAFPGALRNLNEPATADFQARFEGLRKAAGMTVVKPKAAAPR